MLKLNLHPSTVSGSKYHRGGAMVLPVASEVFSKRSNAYGYGYVVFDVILSIRRPGYCTRYTPPP
jgi:hypothetical protein